MRGCARVGAPEGVWVPFHSHPWRRYDAMRRPRPCSFVKMKSSFSMFDARGWYHTLMVQYAQQFPPLREPV